MKKRSPPPATLSSQPERKCCGWPVHPDSQTSSRPAGSIPTAGPRLPAQCHLNPALLPEPLPPGAPRILVSSLVLPNITGYRFGSRNSLSQVRFTNTDEEMWRSSCKVLYRLWARREPGLDVTSDSSGASKGLLGGPGAFACQRSAQVPAAKAPAQLSGSLLFAEGLNGIDLGGRSEEHTSELQSPCNLVC